MSKNTWGLRFTKVNLIEDKFESLLALNIGDEQTTRKVFEDIKEDFKENTGEPDCVIDLLDEDDSIVDDFPITEKQATKIAALLGLIRRETK